MSAADDEWAVECRHFDVQVRLFTANADDEDIKASLRRVIGLGAQLSRGRTHLVVIEVETVASVGLLLAHSAAVHCVLSGVRIVLVDGRAEDIHRVHEGSATACAIGGGLGVAWAEGCPYDEDRQQIV